MHLWNVRYLARQTREEFVGLIFLSVIYHLLNILPTSMRSVYYCLCWVFSISIKVQLRVPKYAFYVSDIVSVNCGGFISSPGFVGRVVINKTNERERERDGWYLLGYFMSEIDKKRGNQSFGN